MNNLTDRQMDALDRIESKPALQPFFFRKLKGLKWFDELKKRGFLDPERNPKPEPSDKEGFYRVPSWPIMDYLEQTAPELRQPENCEYSDKFLNVIREVTQNATTIGIHNYRTWWYFAKIIRFIPIEKITVDDIKQFDYWLKDPFDRMLIGTELGENLRRFLDSDSTHAHNLSIVLIEALTTLTWNSKMWENSDESEAELPVDAYHSKEIFSTYGKGIGERLEDKGVNIFRNRISEIFSKLDKDKYSTIWRPAIEDHRQNWNSDDAINILVGAMRDALLGYVDRRASAAVDYVGKLLSDDTVIFKRIAIYVINIHKGPLRELAKTLVDLQYFRYDYQHEMYHLLQNCFTDFSDSEKQKTLQIIEIVAKKSMDSDQTNDIRERQQAYTWLTWLSAVRGKGSQKADDLYEKNLAITIREPEHPDFSSYFGEFEVAKDISPYSVDELLSRDISGVVNILKLFKEENLWNTPSRRGLALTLKETLKIRPKLFAGNLIHFKDIDCEYKYYLIEGYKELWNEKQYDNWAELLEFCWVLLQSEEFWLEDVSEPQGFVKYSSRRIVGLICELIREGVIDDRKAFVPSLLPKAGKIIENILGKQRGDSFTEVQDAVFVAINSPRGMCVQALICYALRLCRLADKNCMVHDEQWKNELQPIFDKQVDQVRVAEVENYEFVTLFARHLPNFFFLSQSWTMKQLPIIFNKENRLGWLCAMHGYTYVNKVYPEVYKFLLTNGHVHDALDSEEIGYRSKEKIIQNIAVAYLWGIERHGNQVETISWLINRWRLDEIHHLIWFYWSLRDGKSDFSEKLIPLWAVISRRVDTQNEADKRVLSKLCLWSVFVDELNEQTMALLLQSTPFSDLEHNSYIVIRELRRLVESYPDQVADIFIRMLEVFAPTYNQEDIDYVISKLSEKGGNIRIKANRIRDRFIEYEIQLSDKQAN